jgi:hypothetical protein
MGQTLHAHSKGYMTFEYPKGSGEWRSVKSVKIRRKGFVREAIVTSAHDAAWSVDRALQPLFYGT